jgi:hypothetical protein
MKDVNLRPEAMKLLEEKRGNTSEKLNRQDFFGNTPEAQETKAKINQRDYIKFISFYISQGNNWQSERSLIESD